MATRTHGTGRADFSQSGGSPVASIIFYMRSIPRSIKAWDTLHFGKKIIEAPSALTFPRKVCPPCTTLLIDSDYIISQYSAIKPAFTGHIY